MISDMAKRFVPLLLGLQGALAQSEWTRVAHCDSASAGISMDMATAQIQSMAGSATQVKICSRGDRQDCITSNAGAYPIVNLRNGIMLLSHINGQRPCDRQCMEQFWSGSDARLAQMSTACGNTALYNQNPRGDSGFWACNTTGTLSFNLANVCNWNYKDGWYDGGLHSSCTRGCETEGLSCTEAMLEQKNGEVAGSENLLNLIRGVGGRVPIRGDTELTSCSDRWSTSSDVPGWEGNTCSNSLQGRASNTYDCNRVQASHGKHRMCYCHSATTPTDAGLEILINWASEAPTPAPTPAPTAWYQNSDHAGTNVTLLVIQIEALQAQVRALQGTVGSINVAVAAIPATVTAVSSRVEGIAEIQEVQDATIAEMRNAIRAAISALPLETAQLPAGPGGSSSQSPAVTASGPDIEVAAPDGTVKLVSNVCGIYDPCLSRLILTNITRALQEMRVV